MREMIIQMLALDPTKRPDAATLHEEVLRHDCQNMKQCQKSHRLKYSLTQQLSLDNKGMKCF